ncbi:MAG TPA: hypothetical protein VFW40_04585 [Capsulimonadaceae bacterium]|nr:hypothetical protein [Capsulimonadaceae bacterium]
MKSTEEYRALLCQCFADCQNPAIIVQEDEKPADGLFHLIRNMFQSDKRLFGKVADPFDEQLAAYAAALQETARQYFEIEGSADGKAATLRFNLSAMENPVHSMLVIEGSLQFA